MIKMTLLFSRWVECVSPDVTLEKVVRYKVPNLLKKTFPGLSFIKSEMSGMSETVLIS